MKIDHLGISKVMKNYGNQNNDQSQKVEKVKKKDELSLSGKVKQLQKLKEDIDYSHPVREEKVAELKQQLKQGNYNVKGENVAENMLNQVINRKI